MQPAPQPHKLTEPSQSVDRLLDLKAVNWLNLRDLFASNRQVATLIFRDYFDRLEQSFPAAEERPAFDRVLQRIQDPKSPLQIVCALDGSKIIGARQFKILDGGSAGIFAAGEFIFSAPEYRNLRLGTAIVEFSERMMIAHGARFIIGEFHDPLLCSDKDRASDARSGMTPEGRLQFWLKRGYQQFDAPYLCPPVFGSTEWIYNLTLGFRQLGSGEQISSFTSNEYLGILCSYWNSFASGYQAAREFHTLFDQVVSAGEVTIIPLLSRRRFLQNPPGGKQH